MKLSYFVLLLPLLLMAACGGPSEESATDVDEALDNSEELATYYAERPEFFGFKTMADIPADLTWENGDHLAEVGSPEAKKGGTEYLRIQDFPRTLRTTGPDSNGSFRVYLLDDVMMGFAHPHPDEFEYFPGIAESWAVDRENKTVYVKIDQNAVWSDGHPITTEDVMFMFFFYQSSYIVAPWYNNWYSTQYTNVTAYDDHTFSITVAERKPDMDARVLELRPLPRHFYYELGDDFVERYQWKFEPTTAPYILARESDMRKGRSVTLTRNKDWWAADKKHWRYRYNADKLHISVIRDTPKHFEAFKRGDIDQFNLRLSEYWYEKLPNEDADVAGGFIHKSVFYNDRPRPTYGMWINTSKDLLDNQDIRLGINYAANWSLVIDKFFRGDYVRMRTSSDGYGVFTHPELSARSFDIEKAQEHFAKAGFKARGPDGILVNEEGQRLSFTFSTGYEHYKDILTILKEEAIKAGLELRLEVLDSTSGWKKVQEKKHDIHFVAFAVGLEMYPRFWDFYHADNAYDVPYLEDGSVNPERKPKTQTNNLELVAIPEMDRLINEYRASDDKEEMIRLAHTMTQMHHDHASFVPGFVEPMYRVGHWRWVRYPEGFNYKLSRRYDELFVHWIDTDIKEETLAARKDGKTFEPEINDYDQFKTP
ncbi:MAG: ABC transporter substrate-binding protein [Pseudomonadales bacterium]|nr:ABC transporter substrate-binding protein [Pseudomonadales bacterium]MBO6703835.1 ABC transporter substrate-binding protein [Pseudomonadales bacterium]MBO7005119.1 ABC transporter substrate-binding protein [Pseudomonadales bacterium]